MNRACFADWKSQTCPKRRRPASLPSPHLHLSYSSTSSASCGPESESLEDSLVVVYITKCLRLSVIDDLYKNGSVDRLEIWHTYSLSDLEKTLLRNKCAEAWFYSRIIPKVEKSWIF